MSFEDKIGEIKSCPPTNKEPKSVRIILTDEEQLFFVTSIKKLSEKQTRSQMAKIFNVSPTLINSWLSRKMTKSFKESAFKKMTEIMLSFDSMESTKKLYTHVRRKKTETIEKPVILGEKSRQALIEIKKDLAGIDVTSELSLQLLTGIVKKAKVLESCLDKSRSIVMVA